MTDYHQVFLDIMDTLHKHYSYLAFKKVTIDHLKRRYSYIMIKIHDEGTFIRSLLEALSFFEDPHLKVIDSHGRHHNTYQKPARPNYDNSFTYQKYFKKGLKILNRAGAVGFYRDILYVHIGSWSSHLYNHIVQIIHFLEFVFTNQKNVTKMILDVRSNSGGNDSFAEKFLSYLIPKGQGIQVSSYKYRLDPNNPRRLGKERKRYCGAHPHIHFNGQVVALIGNACMSSNEYFVMGLEAIKDRFSFNNHKKVTLVGDTTFGSSGSPKEFRHKCGIRCLIPSWVCYTSRGMLLEGHGIKPDIEISPSRTIFMEKDNAFEAALQLLKKQ